MSSMYKFQSPFKNPELIPDWNKYEQCLSIVYNYQYRTRDLHVCVCARSLFLGKLNILNDHVVENFTSGYCFPGPFLLTWISNHIHSNMSDEIAYVFTYIKDAAVEVWEWISNFMSHFTWCVITYPCFNWNLSNANKRGPQCSLFIFSLPKHSDSPCKSIKLSTLQRPW